LPPFGLLSKSAGNLAKLVAYFDNGEYRKELAREVAELLTGAVEGSKSITSASDRLILNIEVARIFGSLGYNRKAAFFSRQVAQLYLQQEGQWCATSALQVLALGAKTYNLQKTSYLNDVKLNEVSDVM
jgi:hypothetical protein